MNSGLDTLHSKLKDLRTQLFNVSKKSNLIYPKAQQGIHSLYEIIALSYFKNSANFIQSLKQSSQINLPEQINEAQLYTLNKLRTASNKAIKEHGHHSLNIALLHLRWCNEENNSQDWVTSPLYFIPIKLKKEENYQIEAQEKVLHVNPALESILIQKWNIRLPETIAYCELPFEEIIQQIQTCFEKSKSLIIKQAAANTIEGNSESWTLDTQEILIGNFTYLNVNLVRDFDNIISRKDLPSLLSSFLNQENLKEQPKSNKQHLSLLDYLINPADPSQEAAIRKVIDGNNLLIDGPPGTGKSQTITNLIAAFIARNKTVLFISSKKTALETVYTKLEEVKLAHLCSIIHHSLNDKKNFIHELKNAYQLQSKLAFNLDKIYAEKQKKIEHYNQAEKFLNRYTKHMKSLANNSSNLSIKNLIDYILDFDLKNDKPSAISENELPKFEHFTAAHKELKNIYSSLNKHHKMNLLAQHAICLLDPLSYANFKDANCLEDSLRREKESWSSVIQLSQDLQLPQELLKLRNLKKFETTFSTYLYFWENEISQTILKKSHAYQDLYEDAKHFFSLQKKRTQLEKINRYWISKFTQDELEHYIRVAEKYEDRFAPFLYAEYRRFLKILNAKYVHHFFEIKHTNLELLILLKEEYSVKNKHKEFSAELKQKYGDKDVLEIYKLAQAWHKELDPKSVVIFNSLMSNSRGQKDVTKLFGAVNKIVADPSSLKTLDNELINNKLQSVEQLISAAPFIQEAFEDLSTLAENIPLYNYFINTPYKLDDVSYNLYQFSYFNYLAKNEDFAQFSIQNLTTYSEVLTSSRNELLKLNAEEISAKQNHSFNKQLREAHLSQKGLSLEQKETQARLKKGLKNLEKEFEKIRAFQSIRLLNEGDSQSIIRALKPVYLMSPHAVGDVLSIDAEQFDLVIFDESSQLSFEESIPALFRAKQCAVVGDEMQLPPMEYFHKKISTAKDYNYLPNSLLQQAQKVLSLSSLKWHYRSRHEELISFNNATFYNNELRTIPPVEINEEKYTPIVIEQITQAAFSYQDIREKPLSFHYVNNSVYHEGKNEKEARYIAELVKHLLLSQQALNIGILCPSSSQQEAIESALTKITYFDKSFVELMNDKYQNDKNFDGIFIQNLENIQGEERDLIIVSMTYGPKEDHTLKMNFGPINQEGGDKRLNVLFSRAKKHMLIVSSMKAQDIHESENSGTTCMKNYLHFAEQLSLGNKAEVKDLLGNIAPSEQATSPWIKELGNRLYSIGYHVEFNHGYSSLKCNLAIKSNESDELFLLGILTDDSPNFYNQSLAHSFVFQTQVLKEFGWEIQLVLAKDYLQNKELVTNQILEKLKILQSTTKPEEKEIEEEEHEDIVIPQEEKLLFTRLEKNENEHLFWELAGNLHDIVIRHGKVGTKGRKLIKTYASVAKVIQEKRKLIKQKEKLGYRRV